MKKMILILMLAVMTTMLNAQDWRASVKKINAILAKYDLFKSTLFYNPESNSIQWITKDWDKIYETKLDEVDITYYTEKSYVLMKCRTKGNKCIRRSFGEPFLVGFLAIKDMDQGKIVIDELNKLATTKWTTDAGTQANMSNGNNSGFPATGKIDEFVKSFLNLWLENPKDINTRLKKFVSHDYLERYDLKIEKCDMNNKIMQSFTIDSIDNTYGEVKVSLFGEFNNKKWLMRCVFRVVKEDGYIYFLPHDVYNKSYITTWMQKPGDTYQNYEDSIHKGEKKENPYAKLVSDFAGLWNLKTPDRNSRMSKFIAPSFVAKKNIKLQDYKINYFEFNDFKIVSADQKTGEVRMQFWGQNKVWTKEAFFKVVKENEQLFLNPSKVLGDFIYPWDYTMEAD